MTISWNTVIFTFRWIFATGEWRIVAGQTFHTVFCGSPLIRGNKRNTEQWASTGQRMDCLSRQNSSLIGPKYPAKFENYCISRSVHRLKITQPNLTILVSFSSAEDVLSNDVKKYDIFGLQGTENPPFRFFGTRGIVWLICKSFRYPWNFFCKWLLISDRYLEIVNFSMPFS